MVVVIDRLSTNNRILDPFKRLFLFPVQMSMLFYFGTTMKSTVGTSRRYIGLSAKSVSSRVARQISHFSESTACFIDILRLIRSEEMTPTRAARTLLNGPHEASGALQTHNIELTHAKRQFQPAASGGMGCLWEMGISAAPGALNIDSRDTMCKYEEWDQLEREDDSEGFLLLLLLLVSDDTGVGAERSTQVTTCNH